jgi:flagellar motor component MotA
MNRDDFIAEYHKASARAIQLSEKARREGLLALQEEIVSEKVNQRDILEFGLRLAVDVMDRDIIDKILSNIVQQEEDKYTRLLMEIKKEAVLLIWEGSHPGFFLAILNSLTDIRYDDDPIVQKFLKEDEQDVIDE